jgi:hypothetical protein
MFDQDLTDNEVMLCRVKAIAASLNGTVVSYTDHGVNARLIGLIEATTEAYPIQFEFNPSYRGKNKIIFKSHFWYREGSKKNSINDYRDYSDRSDQFDTKCDVLSRSNDSMVKSILSKVLTEEYKRQYTEAKKMFLEYVGCDLIRRDLKLKVCELLDRDPRHYANASYPDSTVSNKRQNVKVDVRTNSRMIVSIDVHSIETLKKILALLE